ncbi:MAG: HAD hydrolase family protein [Ktedonobacterales bacterium]
MVPSRPKHIRKKAPDGTSIKRSATLGDQLNDVLMFGQSGQSIAMGNLLATIVGRANVDKASARSLRTSVGQVAAN